MRRLDLVSSMVILVLSGIALFWLIPNHVPTRHDAGDLPPNLIPMLSAGILAFAALLLGISAWRKKDTETDDDQKGEAFEEMGFGLNELGNLAILLAASGVYWLILKHVGFEVASGVLLVAGMWYGGLRKIWIIVGTAVIIPLFISQVAWYTLHIKLP